MGIIDEELQLSREMARDAKLLLQEERTRSAANRAYYALFHAARALLTELRVDAKTHAGTISRFGKHAIKTGLMEKEYGKLLNRVFNLRDKSDYQVTAVIEKDEVKEIVEKLDEFIDEVERVIREKRYM